MSTIFSEILSFSICWLNESFTAINSKAFEVDIARREVKGDNSKLPETIVSTTGRMARMITIGPETSAKIKRLISVRDDRDVLKRRRNALQADLIEYMLSECLPHKPWRYQ